MTILVTGSTGFLGRYFRKNNKLQNTNIIYGSTKRINFTLQFKALYSNIEQILGKQKIDFIIHFASVIPNSFQSANFLNTYLPNIKMMNNLFEFSINCDVKKFIYISGYGSMQDVDNLDITDFYTMSKIGGEHFCKMMEKYGIQAASFRISSPYGEYYHAKNVITLFIDKAMKNADIEVFGTGKREQNFVYAQDIVNAIELYNRNSISGNYDIVSQKNNTMLELAELILKITRSKSNLIINKKPDPQEGYSPNYNYDKARNCFGYLPQYDLEKGLRKYIHWINYNK